MRAWLASTAALSVLWMGCGGKVVFDISDGGAGGGSSTQIGSTSSHASTSITSSVSKSASTGIDPACPDPLPVEGACSVEGQSCPIHLSCCADDAVCKGGFWTYPGQMCKVLCMDACGPDGFACGSGAICVAFIGQSTTYECRANPCGGALDCGCADAYCEEQAMQCNNIQDGYKVLCD